jgi:multidrug efflux pump subunit AcrA (membrane-fusion protein)
MEASLRIERRIRFLPLAAVGVLALAGAALGLALLWHGRPAPATPAAVPIATARVIRTDVQQSQRLNATLGYGPSTTITAPTGTTPAQLQQADAAVRQAQAQYDAAVAAHQAGAQLEVATAGLQSAQAALQLAEQSAIVAGNITSLPAPGAMVGQGQALYGVNGMPAVLMYGNQPAWRQLTTGAAGADVKQLEQALITLGFASSSNLAIDGDFTAADAAAVRRWQASLGVTQTGSVLLGQVIFLPGPVRVAAVHATLGSQPQPGAPLMDVTSTQHVVTVQVPAEQQGNVHRGDTVSVLMPDGTTTVGGTVLDVSRVATTDQSSQQSSGGGQGQNQPPTVTATIRLANEAAAGGLDQAPVYVSITTAMHRGVLAVPVTALQAQLDGSYAVAVRTGARRRLVTVEPGLFDARGLVEVNGPGLSAGDRVEVPAQ